MMSKYKTRNDISAGSNRSEKIFYLGLCRQ